MAISGDILYILNYFSIKYGFLGAAIIHVKKDEEVIFWLMDAVKIKKCKI